MKTTALGSAMTAFALLGVLFAGCLDETGPARLTGPAVVDTSDVEAGSFYQFGHRGGALAIGLQEGSELILYLYGPDDTRLGRVELAPDTFGDDVSLDGLPAGDYVIAVEAVNGTLLLQSAGTPLTQLTELGRHVERHVIAEGSRSADPLGALGPFASTLGPSDPVDLELPIDLHRTPTFMGLLVSGAIAEGQVTVRSPGGAVALHGEWVHSGRGDTTLEAMPSEFTAHAAKGANYTVRVVADDLEGVLILEAYSYSRHIPENRIAAHPSDDDVPFVYGELPGRPVAFQVHERATALYASARDPRPEPEQISCEADLNATACQSDLAAFAATVAIYGPDDTRLGVYNLVPGNPVKIPVDEGGEYVAISGGGVVVLGADQVPIDFEMHVLDVTTTRIGSEAVGSRGNYDSIDAQFEPEGTVFLIAPAVGDGARNDDPADIVFFGACSDEGMFRLMQGNETLAFWGSGMRGDQWPPLASVTEGPVHYWQDGLGGTCGQTAADLHAYHR